MSYTNKIQIKLEKIISIEHKMDRIEIRNKILDVQLDFHRYVKNFGSSLAVELTLALSTSAPLVALAV